MNPFELGDVEFGPGDFSGVARLFPIPDLIMFPHVVQPLRVFEERYREMMEDALAGDELIAVPVLKPGWEAEYAGRPPLERWGCLGRVVLHNKLDDGCYNLLLMGVARIEIGRELDPVRSFRQAEAQIVDEFEPAEGDTYAHDLHEQLTDTFRGHLACASTADAVEQLAKQTFPLGQLTDLMAYALPICPSDKLRLLGEPSVLRRAEYLVDLLGDEQPISCTRNVSAGKFPPRLQHQLKPSRRLALSAAARQPFARIAAYRRAGC